MLQSWTCSRTACLAAALCCVASHPARVRAQDEAEDRGSRAARADDEDAVRWGTDYTLGALGGFHVQGERFGPMVYAGVDETLRFGAHRLEGDADYLYDPFSTKTFNFADEDQVTGDEERLVQGMHELDGELGWRTDWRPWLRHRIRLHADTWFPDQSRDRRWSVTALPELRVGEKAGAFGELRGELFFKKYPNYLVQDRRIDQRGFEGTVEAGYAFGKQLELSAGYELRLTDYLDARYDRLDASGVVVRADESKSYLRQAPFVRLVLTPNKQVRTSLRYRLELHDSRDYDRRMTGLDASGTTLAKYIPDYYDYVRHNLELRLRFKPTKRWRLEALAEVWLRDFDTYEARDVDNVWTGELRSDQSLELGTEAGYRLARFGERGFRHELFVLASASHLMRRSNMRRELSFATNFDVTRIFVGLELEGP